MIIEIKIPTPGESITEVDLSSWLVADGDYVLKDQEIAEIESDKATLPLIADKSGKIKILVAEGETVKVGTIACSIDTDVEAEKSSEEGREKDMKIENSNKNDKTSAGKKDEKPKVKSTPLARKMMEDEGLTMEDVISGLKKITTKEVKAVIKGKQATTFASQGIASREIKRESMSQLRKKLARRLVAVKNETAMLSTFNEVDMSEIIALRKKYQTKFIEAHGVKLGFMSFFVKAVTLALRDFPRVNSMLDGDEVLVPDYIDVSIAVQTEKGLMVPVLRNTEIMGLAAIEKTILELADKARKFRLSIEEMTGGTFSITNGGVFGSMLSTPILNPPQSGILGMHNIIERPVAVAGKVEIRPVMYLALSYDHRIVDGRDSVSFLVRVKELIESPHKMLFEGQDPEKVLLGLT